MLFHLDLMCKMNPTASYTEWIFFYPLSTCTTHMGNKNIKTRVIILLKEVSGSIGTSIFQGEGQ